MNVGWMVGESGNKANSAKLELEWAELVKTSMKQDWVALMSKPIALFLKK